jgi:hypothetical protein
VASNIAELRKRLRKLWPHLNERSRRMTAAAEAVRLGHGGITLVSKACGLSRVTISKGIQELKEKPLPEGKIRRPGGGRLSIDERYPDIVDTLDKIIEPLSRGNPEIPLRWTCKSTRELAAALQRENHRVSHVTIAKLLKSMDYSLQSNRKSEEEEDHPDRDPQFKFMSKQVRLAMRQQLPVISVDTKKKELVGNYANSGRNWRPEKIPKKVMSHDFPDKDVPRAYPYGIYDIGQNHGFVNIGTDHDTSAFAVASIMGWWRHEGRKLYPKAKRLLVTADAGGSNGYRRRLWKRELQKFSDWADLEIMVCHFPPGTSKWNKIEHRLFSFISSNWRGEPLRDYETIVNLISNTTTSTGLTVTCRLDRRKYKTGLKVSKKEFSSFKIEKMKFHCEWNYIVRPR